MKNRITDVFFDLDHTLWDFERNSALTFEKIFLKNDLAINLDAFLSSYIPINQRYWQLYALDKVSKEELRHNRLKESFVRVNFDVNEEMITCLSEDYILHLSDYNFLFDGTLEVLEKLQANYKLHIITNGFKEVQQLKLKNAQIHHYFHTVTTSEDVGVKKPHPLIFEKALSVAQVQPRQSLMIGDNLEADIQGANRAGIETILFDPDDKINHIGQKINTLKELETLLIE